MTLDTTPASPAARHTRSRDDLRVWAFLVALAAAWGVIFAVNEMLWPWLLGDVMRLDLVSTLGAAVEFFLYDTVKISLLLLGLLFLVGLVNTQISPEKVRGVLAGKGLFVGILLAVALGAITPFCSCSSIPIFIGLVAAGVPLSVTLAFLVSSPLISETGIILMGGTFGWDIAAGWALAGAVVSIAVGLVLSRFKLEKWIEPFVFTSRTAQLATASTRPSMRDRVTASWDETRDMLKKILPFLLLGVLIGAAIHGWVPDEFFATVAGPDNPFSLLIATFAGAPLYANPAAVVPLASALYAKGVALGTTMAFMMSLVALSIPSLIMLRRVMKLPLLAIFTGVVLAAIYLIGFIFNLIPLAR
ncbi:MAG: permease [Actinobacteria bacterium]|nr:permease [Actinomycetota bacterium]